MHPARSFLPRPAIAAALFALTALNLSAQVFVGSDNFNDNTLTLQGANPQAAGQWRTSVPNEQSGQTTGAWTETNGRMEYSVTSLTSTTGIDRGQLVWVAPSSSVTAVGSAGLNAGTPYDSTWTARIDVTNLTTRTGTNYSVGGFEIYTTGVVTNPNTTYSATAIDGFYSVMLENFGSVGTRVRSEWGVLDATTFSSTVASFNDHNIYSGALGVTSLQLQLSYDATTRVLTTGYSTNGGSSFVTGASFDLDGAQMPPVSPLNGGLGLRLLAATDNNSGDTISAGSIYFDNLSVSAIPEPSTYALFAGMGAVGLAVWRRKRQNAA